MDPGPAVGHVPGRGVSRPGIACPGDRPGAAAGGGDRGRDRGPALLPLGRGRRQSACEAAIDGPAAPGRIPRLRRVPLRRRRHQRRRRRDCAPGMARRCGIRGGRAGAGTDRRGPRRAENAGTDARCRWRGAGGDRRAAEVGGAAGPDGRTRVRRSERSDPDPVDPRAAMARRHRARREARWLGVVEGQGQAAGGGARHRRQAACRRACQGRSVRAPPVRPPQAADRRLLRLRIRRRDQARRRFLRRPQRCRRRRHLRSAGSAIRQPDPAGACPGCGRERCGVAGRGLGRRRRRVVVRRGQRRPHGRHSGAQALRAR